MNSTSVEHRVSSENNGRDSELPDHILVHILTFLPIVDAVKTVLIRRYDDLWTWLPSLQFSEFHFSKENYILNREVDGGEEVDNRCRSFANFVRNVLILHKKTPIHMFMFKLCMSKVVCKPYSSGFTNWIRFAVDCKVKELLVDLNSCIKPDDGVILPRCLFTSQFLVTLKLNHCLINELSHVHMRSLRELLLYCVALSNDTFEKIILGSPSLQELYLYCIPGLDEVHFTNPSIEKLTLGFYDGLLDCPNLKFLELDSFREKPMQVVNVSSLREVNISSCIHLNALHECLKQFCNVELLEYSDVLHNLSKITDLELPQTRWKRLHIYSQLLGDEFSGICRFLRSSPNLEELVVCMKPLHHSGVYHGTQATNMHALPRSPFLFDATT